MGLTRPADLPEAAEVVWDVVAAELDSDGAVCAVDGELLRAWCCTVVELRAAEAWVSEHGTTFATRDDKGNVKATGEAPKYRQVRALRADLVRLAGELGLSPAARKVIGVGERKATDVGRLAQLRAIRSAG